VKRTTGIARLRRLMSVGLVLAGIGIFVMVAPGLFIGDIRAGMQFEAWLQLGVATLLLSGGALGLFKRR
jgi:hypothetical protein